MCLLMAPEAEGSLECPVAELAHELSLESDCRKGWCVVEEGV